MQTTHPVIDPVQIKPLSDRSVLVSFGNIIDRAINEKVLSLHRTLLQSAFEGFVESVPAYASLAIFFEPQKIMKQTATSPFAFVKKRLLQLMQEDSMAYECQTGIITIPVCYDTEFGIDIKELAEYHQLSIGKVIQLHTSVVYRVFMIGFMPGFAYMGTIVDELTTPRKNQPRLNVPAGSIGIAGSQTGIYPIDSPGGWQIIGKTYVQLFDKNDQSPCLLSAGDNVQFVSIDKNEFKNSGGY